MHLFSYIFVVITTWLIYAMICAGVEGIFANTFSTAVVIATVSWLVGEIVYFSRTISKKKKTKVERKVYINVTN